MNIEQKIKRHILVKMLDGKHSLPLNTSDEVDQAWGMAEAYDGIFSDFEIIDEESDFRCSGETTNLEADCSRHYECDRVATKLDCGTYVSWLYWYGGGKYGEPDGIDWMSDALEVSCAEEEKIVTIKTYSLKGAQNGNG